MKNKPISEVLVSTCVLSPLVSHTNYIHYASYVPFFLHCSPSHLHLLSPECHLFLLHPISLRLTLSTHTHTHTTAVGVDPSHHPLAGEPHAREHHAGHAAEAGGLPRLPPPPQAAQGAGEVPAGDQLQHPADQAEAQQQARLHALGGQDGLGRSRENKRVTLRYSTCMNHGGT